MSEGQALSFYLLGTFAAKRDQQSIKPTVRRKTRALLAYLMVGKRPYSRQTLSDLFFQEAKDPAAALRTLLSRIRRQFGADILQISEDSVAFNGEAAWVDYYQFVAFLADSQSDRATDELTNTLNLYRGEFLSNLSLPDAPEFGLWLLGERARLRQLYERGLAELIRRLIVAGRFEEARRQAQQLVSHNPLLEEGHAHLIWLYARAGQVAAARQQYETCRQLLQDELAVTPTAELQTLLAEIEAGQMRPTLQPMPPVAGESELDIGETAVFVGRETELDQLEQRWQKASQASGGVLLIEAEAGGGKTSLIQQFAQRLSEDRFGVGNCYESTRALPYHPWIELLESYLPTINAAERAQWPPFWRDYLTRLLPSLAVRRRQSPPLAPTSGGDAERLFTVVTDLLCQSSHLPLLIFLDNLQWADEATLQLFQFMARRVSQTAVLLVGAYRLEEVADSPTLQALLSDLNQIGTFRLTLPPLGVETVTLLAKNALPEATPELQGQLAHRVASATWGNPLFITELLRELAGSGELPDRLPIPQTVREVVQRRLQRLPASSRQVVEAVAILDAPATLPQIQQISGRSMDETFTGIDLGLQRGLLLPVVEDEDRYAFSHDLLREAVAVQLSHIRRRLLHRRTAVTLEQGNVSAATLAYHWQMAGDATKEGHFAALAGEDAAAVYANEEAIRRYQQALPLLTNAARKLQVMRQLADVLMLTGRREEVERLYRDGLNLAYQKESALEIANFKALLGRLLQRKGAYQESLRWLEEAVTLYEELEDTEGLSAAEGDRGLAYWYLGDGEKALHYLQRRQMLAESVEDRRSASIAVANMGIVYWSQGQLDQALNCFQQKLAIDEALGDQLSISKVYGNMGIVYSSQGNVAEALACYEQKLHTDVELGDQEGVSKVLTSMGMLYGRLGDPRAMICLRKGLQITLEIGDRQGTSTVLGNMLSVKLMQNDVAGAKQLADRAIALSRLIESPLFLCGQLHDYATLCQQRGEMERAKLLNDEALLLARQVNRQETILSAQILDVRLRLAMNELDEAPAVAELKAILAERKEPVERAALNYAIWQILPDDAVAKQTAVTLYEELYEQTPDIGYSGRYYEITRRRLPAPTPLPELPPIVTENTSLLADLLAQVDKLLSHQKPA